MSNPVLENIKTRRVVREMTDQPVSQEDLEIILEAGRWSPTGSNHLPTRFLVIQDPELIELIRRVSPGIYSNASTYIFVCVDRRDFPTYIDEETDDPVFLMDVGQAAQTMALAAHSIGLASGPVTSFNVPAMRKILNLPPRFTPWMVLCVGHPQPNPSFVMKPSKRRYWQDLVYRERFIPWRDFEEEG